MHELAVNSSYKRTKCKFAGKWFFGYSSPVHISSIFWRSILRESLTHLRYSDRPVSGMLGFIKFAGGGFTAVIIVTR